MAGKEKERSADSQPQWLSGGPLKSPVLSFVWFYDPKYQLPYGGYAHTDSSPP